jgi:cytochrome c oxidase cbb3-type subunit 3
MKPILIAAAVSVLLTACDKQKRVDDKGAAMATTVLAAPVTELHPGGLPPSPSIDNPYAGNAYALNEGKRLFAWYNCSGCHSNGGGGMGPPLMDDLWIYGKKPANIFQSITQGRPNGMPAFGGKIPEHQMWQIVTFIQHISKAPTEN